MIHKVCYFQGKTRDVASSYKLVSHDPETSVHSPELDLWWVLLTFHAYVRGRGAFTKRNSCKSRFLWVAHFPGKHLGSRSDRLERERARLVNLSVSLACRTFVENKHDFVHAWYRVRQRQRQRQRQTDKAVWKVFCAKWEGLVFTQWCQECDQHRSSLKNKSDIGCPSKASLCHNKAHRNGWFVYSLLFTVILFS